MRLMPGSADSGRPSPRAGVELPVTWLRDPDLLANPGLALCLQKRNRFCDGAPEATLEAGPLSLDPHLPPQSPRRDDTSLTTTRDSALLYKVSSRRGRYMWWR